MAPESDHLPRVEFDPGRVATVTLVLTQEEAQAVFDRLYVYETDDDGYLARSVVAQLLLASGAVTPA